MPLLPLKHFKLGVIAFLVSGVFLKNAQAKELYLEPVIQNYTVEDIVTAIDEDNRIYIDWDSFASGLSLKNTYDQGIIKTELFNKKIDFDPAKMPLESYKIKNGQYYFDREVLEKKLNLKLNINKQNMQLEIKANQELPIVQKILAQSRRRNMQPYPQYDSFNNYQFDNRLFGSPISDLTLQNNYDIWNGNDGKERKNSVFYQLDTGMLAAGLDVYTSFFGNSRNDNFSPRARITAGRTFLDEPKNALNLVSFEAGDVSGFNSTLFNNSANGRGIMASSFKDLILSADKTIDLSGPLSAGWDVELYLNDQLISFRQSSQNGRYLFSNIPVNFGLNTFKLVFYGPYGEILTEEREYYSGTSPVKKGEFGYTFNAYQKDRYLIEQNEPWINPTNKPTIDFTGYYGFDDETTFISGITQTYNPATFAAETFASAGLQYVFGGASVQYNTLFDINSKKTGHHVDVQGNIKIGTVFARYDYYGDIQAPTAYYNDFFMKDIWEVRLSGFLPFKYLPYYVSYIERNAQNGQKYQEIHARLSPNFMQYYNFSIENVYTKTSDGSSNYLLLLLQAQYNALGLHSQVRIDIKPQSYVQGLNQQIDYRWDKNTYFQFNWDHEYRSKYTSLKDLDSFSFSAGRLFGFGGLNLGITHNTDNNTSFMLTYNLSFGKVPGEPKLFTDAQTQMSQQAAIYAKMTDEKNAPVAHTQLRVSGLQKPYYTDENGRVLISDIAPYQKTVLNVDAESIEDISLVPEFEEKKLVLRPGTVYPLHIKCTRKGGIEGYITGRPDLFTYKILLVDDKGNSVTKIPQQDGSFIFDEIVFGKYDLQVINPKGKVIHEQKIDLNTSFYVLPRAIKLK